MVKIEVHYVVEVEDKDFKKALGIAQESGHGFNDAGPVETVRRCLMDEGFDGAFPSDRFDIRHCITRLDDDKPRTYRPY